MHWRKINSVVIHQLKSSLFFSMSKMCNTQILVVFLSLVTIGLTTTVSPLKAAIDNELNKLKSLLPENLLPPIQNQTTCSCAVFLSDQFKKGSADQPTGNPALLHEQDSLFPCTPFGSKQCTNKCLEMVCCIWYSYMCAVSFNFFSIYFSAIFAAARLSNIYQIHQISCVAVWIEICTRNEPIYSYRTVMANGLIQIYQPAVNFAVKMVPHISVRLWNRQNNKITDATIWNFNFIFV